MTGNSKDMRLGKGEKTFSTSIDLPKKERQEIIRVLNQHLADTIDLYSMTKHAHWNVKGPGFYQLHELFDGIADRVEEYVDTIAERVTALGGYAMGTVRIASRVSTLDEYPLDATDGLEHVKALVSRFSHYGKKVRGDIYRASEMGDMDTADLFTEISRGIDKDLWFLEAHLQGSGGK